MRVTERDGPKKLTYVVGDEPVLREEIIDAVRLTVDAEERDTESLTLGQDSPAKIWSAMSQHASDPTRSRLVVVRCAEKLRTERLAAWLKGANLARIHVVMSDGRPTWPADRDSDARDRIVKSSMSMLVDCTLPKSGRQAKAAKIAATCWSTTLSETAALHLARRTNADLARMRDVCRWGQILGRDLEPKVIDALVREDPGTEFAGHLLALDRKAACEAARQVPSTRRAINEVARGLMDAELLCGSLAAATSRYPEPNQARFAIGEAAKITGLSVPRVSQLWRTAKHYDASTVRRRTEALVRADSHRDDVGVLETLTTEW